MFHVSLSMTYELGDNDKKDGITNINTKILV